MLELGFPMENRFLKIPALNRTVPDLGVDGMMNFIDRRNPALVSEGIPAAAQGMSSGGGERSSTSPLAPSSRSTP